VLSTTFGLSVNAVLWTFRFALFVLPPLAAWATYRLCKELAARDGLPVAEKVHWRQIPGRLRRGVDRPSPNGDRGDRSGGSDGGDDHEEADTADSEPERATT